MALRVLVVSEGQHELGDRIGEDLTDNGDLPALPRLLHRLLDQPEGCVYHCMQVKDEVFRISGQGPAWQKRATMIMDYAQSHGFGACVVLIDRDGDKPQDRLKPLADARDMMAAPCAVGNAVQAFDAWMICDPTAIEKAGGDGTKHADSPEKLPADRKKPEHAKNVAYGIFGKDEPLWPRYAQIVQHVRLDHLAKRCPKGFGPFAKEVKRHLGPLMSPTN